MLSRAVPRLRHESLEDSASLPELDVIAAGIVEELQAALEQVVPNVADLKPVPA